MARARTVRWLQGILTVVAAFGAFYLFLVMIQPYRNQMFLAEKRGRVVDAQTGEGLADVAVVMNYQSTFIAPFRTSSGCIHQKIVRTDAEGFFVVPDASKDIDVADGLLKRMLPGFSESYGWALLFYKEGYMREDEMGRYRAAVETGRDLGSVVRRPGYTKEGRGYVVPLVQMEKVDTQAEDLAVDAYLTYVRHLSNAMWCFRYAEGHSKELVELQADIKGAARKLICELPPSRVLSALAKRSSFVDCASSLGMQEVRRMRGGAAGAEASTVGEMCESYKYVPSEYECQGSNVKLPPMKIIDSRARRSQDKSSN